MMQISYDDAVQKLELQLAGKNYSNATFMAETAIWLEACGYAGLQELSQALADAPQEFKLSRTVLGLDLRNISCAIIGDQVLADVVKNGRVYLRNVRHGLFLLAGSVHHNFGIGCPIDPAFALGGQRGKNPYKEKMELAKRDGLQLDEGLWLALMEN